MRPNDNNELHRTLARGGGASVDAALAKMVQYSQTHFAHEEAQMQDRRYPELPEHRRNHEGFVQRIQSLRTRYQSGHKEAGGDLLNLLSSWWLTHISTVDARLARFLKK